jgi:hypothetical protein
MGIPNAFLLVFLKIGGKSAQAKNKKFSQKKV